MNQLVAKKNSFSAGKPSQRKSAASPMRGVVYSMPMMALLLLLLLLFSLLPREASGFSIATSRVQTRRVTDNMDVVRPSYKSMTSSSVPEYSVKDEEDSMASLQDDEEIATMSDEDSLQAREEKNDDVVVRQTQEHLAKRTPPATSLTLFAAAEPTGSASTTAGGILNLQVMTGDLNLARKAWKKRRRSGSPLLVPCSVLAVDGHAVLRENCQYLLHKFGIANQKSLHLSLAQLTKRHAKHLQSSLTRHAEALGYETASELVEALFATSSDDGEDATTSSTTETSGSVQLVYDDQDPTKLVGLQAPFLSRRRAQQRANRAVILQFRTSTDADENEENPFLLHHTGMVRKRIPKQQSTADEASANSKSVSYQLVPLSAALRISAKDMALMESGSLHQAVVFDYEPVGDAGNPLLTLSLAPPSTTSAVTTSSTNRQSKAAPSTTTTTRTPTIAHPQYWLDELKVGDGPLMGTVTRLVPDGAWVDCQVGHDPHHGDDDSLLNQHAAQHVYGTLRFADAVIVSNDDKSNNDSFEAEDDEEPTVPVEDWDALLSLDELDDDGEEEVVEDITDLYAMTEDGELAYKDPETGKATQLVAENQKDENAEKDESNDLTTEAKDTLSTVAAVARRQQTGRRQWLHVGDQVQVFVKSISTKTGQLVFSMDSTIQGQSAKNVKKQGQVSKKLSRLLKQLGGWRRVEELTGLQCHGTVKAVSNTGDWFYVQPDSSNDQQLPVGVATVPSEEICSSLQQGDAVRIEIQGVDESRGQLAMKVLSKLD